ncbi:hypothetical protein POL68_14775 [Stigmatella sp. ncwal1]|uniref:Uncharacterized protein n=1 Tax=Stigmatella ashevillensis TaxID=2995309 RepID=A0ABT5D7T9_9BACT|nr:hypothetical protein [Stigmatella ashevillena]MDC0709733.1 hypothetical protein [Stigmatella ashevillena]
MLFFDLEAYVPPHDRSTGWSSLVVNPVKPDHVLLGGCFFSKRFEAPIPEDPAIDGLWLWNFESEAALLLAIKARFEKEWHLQRQEAVRILGKPAQDLVVCGAGIAKFDIPALFCRSHVNGICDPAELFELYFKARPIELSNVASFLFRSERILYPKTTKEMAGRLGLSEKKGSSKSVWECYETRDYATIEQRTRAELLTVLHIYKRLQDRIHQSHPTN